MNKERLASLAERLSEIPNAIFEKQGMILDYNEQTQNISNEISQNLYLRHSRYLLTTAP